MTWMTTPKILSTAQWVIIDTYSEVSIHINILNTTKRENIVKIKFFSTFIVQIPKFYQNR